MSRHIARSILPCLLAAVLGAAEGFAGRWQHGEGAQASVATIRVDAGYLTGQVEEDGQRLPFAGPVDGRRAQVHVAVDGEALPATLVLHPDRLEVTFAGEVLVYRRAAAQPVPERTPPPAPVADAPAAERRAAPRQTPKAGAVTLAPRTVTDPGMGGMDSHTLLVPAGWQLEGGAWWAGEQLFQIMPSQDITVTGPGGVSLHLGPTIGATDFLPSQLSLQLGVGRPAEGTAQGGYPVMHFPGDLDGWRRWLLERGLPSARPEASGFALESLVVVPELTALMQRNFAPIRQQQEQANRQAQAMGQPSRMFCEASVLAASVRYDEGGSRWEQLFIFGAYQLGTDNEYGRQLWWGLDPNVAFRAPAGELETHMPLLMAITNSLQPTPEWARMRADHRRQLNRIAAEGAAQRSSLLADSSDEISRIISEGWNQRQAISDATHRKVIDSIRGVETYHDAGVGHQVQLPNTYRHVYANGQGGYALSNDANFDPNLDPALRAQDWTSLHAAP